MKNSRSSMTEPKPFSSTLRAAGLDQSMAETAAIPSLGGYDEDFVNTVAEDSGAPNGSLRGISVRKA